MGKRGRKKKQMRKFKVQEDKERKEILTKEQVEERKNRKKIIKDNLIQKRNNYTQLRTYSFQPLTSNSRWLIESARHVSASEDNEEKKMFKEKLLNRKIESLQKEVNHTDSIIELNDGRSIFLIF